MRASSLVLVLLIVGCTGASPATSGPLPTGQRTGLPTASAEPTDAPTPSASATTPPASASPAASATPSASAAGSTTITSADGVVTIEIPNGALPAGVPLSIEPRSGDDAPPELAEVNLRPSHYALLPGGTTFSQPVQVTQRVPLASIVRPEGISLVILALRGDDGAWEWLAEPSMAVDGDEVAISGTTTHFSSLYRWSDRTEIVIDPTVPRSDLVGSQFVRTLELVSRDERPNRIAFTRSTVTYDNHNPDVLRVDQGSDAVFDSQRVWTCLMAGDYTVTFSAEVGNFAADNAFWTDRLRLPAANPRVTFNLDGGCVTEQAELTFLCIRVVHQPLGTFLSYLDWLLGIEGDEDVDYIEVVMENVQDGLPVRLDLNPDGRWMGRGGLRGAGPKKIISVIVHFSDGSSTDITQSTIADLGTDTLTVRFPEQDVFGDCPPS